MTQNERSQQAKQILPALLIAAVASVLLGLAVSPGLAACLFWVAFVLADAGLGFPVLLGNLDSLQLHLSLVIYLIRTSYVGRYYCRLFRLPVHQHGSTETPTSSGEVSAS